MLIQGLFLNELISESRQFSFILGDDSLILFYFESKFFNFGGWFILNYDASSFEGFYFLLEHLLFVFNDQFEALGLSKWQADTATSLDLLIFFWLDAADYFILAFT